MKTKELKIQAPEGYEIDIENSTFECIIFKPIKKNITYKDICNSLFKRGYYINSYGVITTISECVDYGKTDKNNATNKKQLKRLLALNQLLNIAEYYNNKVEEPDGIYLIAYNDITYMYEVCFASDKCLFGLNAHFSRK